MCGISSDRVIGCLNSSSTPFFNFQWLNYTNNGNNINYYNYGIHSYMIFEKWQVD